MRRSGLPAGNDTCVKPGYESEQRALWELSHSAAFSQTICTMRLLQAKSQASLATVMEPKSHYAISCSQTGLRGKPDVLLEVLNNSGS